MSELLRLNGVKTGKKGDYGSKLKKIEGDKGN